MSFSSFKIGEKYSKTDLSEIFNNPNHYIFLKGEKINLDMKITLIRV